MAKRTVTAQMKRQRSSVDPAGLVGDLATEQMLDQKPTEGEVRRVMSMLGKIGGPKGGAARAAKLSAQERKDIASKAAKARWDRDEKSKI